MGPSSLRRRPQGVSVFWLTVQFCSLFQVNKVTVVISLLSCFSLKSLVRSPPGCFSSSLVVLSVLLFCQHLVLIVIALCPRWQFISMCIRMAQAEADFRFGRPLSRIFSACSLSLLSFKISLLSVLFFFFFFPSYDILGHPVVSKSIA